MEGRGRLRGSQVKRNTRNSPTGKNVVKKHENVKLFAVEKDI